MTEKNANQEGEGLHWGTTADGTQVVVNQGVLTTKVEQVATGGFRVYRLPGMEVPPKVNFLMRTTSPEGGGVRGTAEATLEYEDVEELHDELGEFLERHDKTEDA